MVEYEQMGKGQGRMGLSDSYGGGGRGGEDYVKCFANEPSVSGIESELGLAREVCRGVL